MKLLSLFSGGKDSTLATYIMKKKYGHNIACLLSVKSKNPHSYMFHTPNIDLTKIQSSKMNIPIEYCYTNGLKEYELIDLKEKIKELKNKYDFEGVVTGAVRSIYQNSRIQKICKDLDLWCFNPLWLIKEEELLDLLKKYSFKAIISGIAAYPLDKSFLGKDIFSVLPKLKEYNIKYDLSLVGEGGEFETTVLDCPLFKDKIEILKSEIIMEDENTGKMIIKKVI